MSTQGRVRQRDTKDNFSLTPKVLVPRSLVYPGATYPSDACNIGRKTRNKDMLEWSWVMGKLARELWSAVDAEISPSFDATRSLEGAMHVLSGSGTRVST